MTILSHVLITSFGIKLLGLQGNDLIYAYTFGVLPDLDHLIKIPSYVKANGVKIVRHYPWRTFLQEPMMLIPISIFSYLINSWCPLVFFSLHLLLDYLMSFEKNPFAPFNNFKTNGFMVGVRDFYKEFAMITSVIIGSFLI